MSSSRSARERPTAGSREWIRKALVACGPLSVLTYVGWAELAALQWDNYSRIRNAISELFLSDSPSGGFLQPWEGVVYNALLIAFGIGVWQSARGHRPLRVVGALQVLLGAAFPIGLAFGEASLAAHVGLAMVGVLTWLGTLAFGAAALGRRFRLYSLITLAVVLVFNALAFMYIPQAAAGEPMGVIGLFERIAFSAYYLWIVVLAVILWPSRFGKEAPHSSAQPSNGPRFSPLG